MPSDRRHRRLPIKPAMNLLLLLPEDFISPEQAIIRDQRRLRHILTVHKAEVGDQLKVGLINGNMGQGIITALDDQQLGLSVILQDSPPTPLPLTLILALPRPKMLKRIVQAVATLGVKELVLINSYRVEKSYWQTPLLTPDALRAQLILGLEQGGDTHLPNVRLEKRFKPFVEDDLPQLIQGSRALVAHPYTTEACPRAVSEQITLAVGPEGGFIPYEIDLLAECGFQAVHLGNRIMRVETAIPFLISRLF